MWPSIETRRRLKAWWRKEGRPFLVLVVLLFSGRSSLADWNDVPTGSMKPTILEGDRVFVNKLAYDLKVPFTTMHVAEWSNPKRGDIVVFFSPHDGQRLVKRVTGLPGDVIELRGNKLLINGKGVQYRSISEELVAQFPAPDRSRSSYAQEELPDGTSHIVAAMPLVTARRDFGPFVVPEGHYFMMGDNRDDSFDSRYYGAVPRRQIVGRAEAIVISLDRTEYWKPRLERFFRTL